MKTSNKMQSPIIIMFWSAPSCSMLKDYKLKSDTLYEAIKYNRAVEVITNSNKTLTFKKIGINTGKYFGMEKIKGKIKKMLLNINEIKMVTLI